MYDIYMASYRNIRGSSDVALSRQRLQISYYKPAQKLKEIVSKELKKSMKQCLIRDKINKEKL